MSKPVRAGVVGVGHLGRHHARIYASLPGVQLVGVVDSSQPTAERIASEYGARVFPDAASLAKEVDLASVAVPTVSHLEAAEALLERGVPVLVEKPIADTIASAQRLIDTARRHGVLLMVGHTERFNPAVLALVQRMKAPQFIEIHRLAPFVPRSLDVDVVLDLMIHDLDLCRWFLRGGELSFLDASGSSVLTERIDIATVRLRFANGAAANLTASRVSTERMRRIRVFEAGSFLGCDTGLGTVQALRVGTGPDGNKQLIPEQVQVASGEPLVNELQSWVDAVRRQSASPCSGEDGLAALDLALQVVKQIDSSPPVRSA